MENVKPPIKITEVAQLEELGICSQHVTWARVTMTSDAFICIRYEEKEKSGKYKAEMQKQLMVLNLQRQGYLVKTWPMSPESAKISPPRSSTCPDEVPWIAIKTGSVLMVLRLEPSWEMVAKCHVEEITFWTWLSSTVIAVVTDKVILHWDILRAGIPEPVFWRHQRLAFSEVISYKADEDMRWFAVTGLLPQEDCITGVAQLFSVDHDLTQCITAHTVTFVKYKFEGNEFPSTVLCIATRDPGLTPYGKVHVIELGPHQKGNLAPCSHYDVIQFQEDADRYDFPVSLEVSTKYGLIYTITKYGQLFICDLDTASCLFSTVMADNIVFTSILNTATQGILGVSRTGQVLSVELQTEDLVHYVEDVVRKPASAQRLRHALVEHCAISGQSLI